MSWFAWSLVIFLTAMTGFLGGRYGLEWLLDRAERKRIPLARLADPAPLPGELPVAGYFDLPDTLARFTAPDGPYGSFPADTGPLLLWSEKTAANVALEREIRQRCAEAEAKIPPRWRS